MPEFAILAANVDLLGTDDIYFPVEDHKFSAQLTHYPVESGKDLSDNYVRAPNVIILTGVVSDVPPGVHQGSAAVVWSQIESLAGGPLVTIATHIRTYSNMALIECDARRANGIRNGLEFRAEFREVLFASSALLEITPVVVAPAGPAAQRTATVPGGSRVSPTVSAPRFSSTPSILIVGDVEVAFDSGVATGVLILGDMEV